MQLFFPPHSHVHRAVSVAERLSEEGFPARYIAGGQPQEERMATMHALRTFALRVLVTTDLVRDLRMSNEYRYYVL